MTSQRASMPAPRTWASNDWSISATPPPTAVELMFQTTRPARSLRALSMSRSNCTVSSRSSSSRIGSSGSEETCISSTGAGKCLNEPRPIGSSARDLMNGCQLRGQVVDLLTGEKVQPHDLQAAIHPHFIDRVPLRALLGKHFPFDGVGGPFPDPFRRSALN